MNVLSTPENSVPVQAVGKKFGIRTAAYLIDMAIYLGVTFVTGFTIAFAIALILIILGREPNFDEGTNSILSFAISLFIGVMYFTLFEWLYTATPGKLILGMRVVRENGKRPNLSQPFLRGLLRYVDIFFFGLVAYLTMKPPLYQRVGDQAAKTIVVDKDDPVIRDRPEWWWFMIAAVAYLILDIIVTTILAMVDLQ